MSKENRIKFGKLWKLALEQGLPVPKNMTLEHPWIKEYEDSIKEEPKEKSRGKR